MSKKRCAKWCGRGCTEEEYQKAKRDAKELCKKLGPGWKPHIWENLGWHFHAVKGNIHVMQLGDEYSTLMGEGGAGEMFWSPKKWFKDPKKAVKHQLYLARKHVKKCQEMILRSE